MAIQYLDNKIRMQRDILFEEDEIEYNPADYMIFDKRLFKTSQEFADEIQVMIENQSKHKLKIEVNITQHEPENPDTDCICFSIGSTDIKLLIPPREEITVPNRETLTLICINKYGASNYPEVVKTMNDIQMIISQLSNYIR